MDKHPNCSSRPPPPDTDFGSRHSRISYNHSAATVGLCADIPALWLLRFRATCPLRRRIPERFPDSVRMIQESELFPLAFPAFFRESIDAAEHQARA